MNNINNYLYSYIYKTSRLTPSFLIICDKHTILYWNKTKYFLSKILDILKQKVGNYSIIYINHYYPIYNIYHINNIIKSENIKNIINFGEKLYNHNSINISYMYLESLKGLLTTYKETKSKILSDLKLYMENF